MDFFIRKYKQLFNLLSKSKNHDLTRRPLCNFLKSREEIEECRRILYRNGFITHVHKCKDWDLASIIPAIDDGNFLDMGSSDSSILKNISILKIHGDLYGIDLREPIKPVRRVKYTIGDLMDTKLPDNYFKNITCLSVIEHEVDFKKFAHEVSRLLQPDGKIFITFDYWDPKIKTDIKLYDLKWQPLDKQAVNMLIAEFELYDLYLVEDIDWTLIDPVIDKDYYSPDPLVSYTFGLLTFEKRNPS
jgi:SAM-dependent methyltransferase